MDLERAVNRGDVDTLLMAKWTYKILHIPVRNNNFHVTLAVLKNHKSLIVDDVDKRGLTALQVAVIMGYTEIVELLLDHGASIHASIVIGGVIRFTLLHLAVARQYPRMVKLLLDRDATQIDQVFFYGHTALHLAIKSSNEVIVKLLLEGGANVNTFTKEHKLPIDLAVGRNISISTIRLIMDKGSILDNFSFYCVNEFFPNRIEHMLMAVLDMLGPSLRETVAECWAFEHDPRTGNIHETIYDSFRSIVHQVSMLGRVDILGEILKRQPKLVDDFDGRCLTPLWYAVHNEKLEAVKLLLRNGARITDSFKSSVQISTKMKKLLVRHLVLRGEDGMDNWIEDDCISEISKLKNMKLGNSNVTAYAVLNWNVHKSCGFARNEEVVEAMNSTDFKSQCPIYADLIDENFKCALARCKLLDNCDAFEDNILDYLSNDDLRNVITAKHGLVQFGDKKN